MEFWYLITLLGNAETYLFLIPLIYFVIEKRLGWRILLLSVVAAGIVHVLKDFFKVPRPPKELWKIEAHGYSFPSGHATGSSAFWLYLSIKIKQKWIYILSASLIALISFSRIILGVHHLSDILAGIMLGAFLAFVFDYADKAINKKLKREKKKKGLIIGTAIILLFSPYLLTKLPIEASILLGFGLGHVVSELLNLKERRKLEKKIASFVISCSLISLYLITNNIFLCFAFGFFACMLPQFIWHFIDKRVKKQR